MRVAPLAGRSVVVTRSRAQQSALVDRLASLGATVVELPVIAVEDPPDGGAALSASIDRLVSGSYRWVVCTSPNAAVRLLAGLGDRRVPDPVRWAAVGTGTASVLTGGGYPPALVPAVAVAEAVAEAFPVPGPPTDGAAGGGTDGPATVLFPRAETVRADLARRLRQKGWQVDEVVAYRTVAGDPPPDRTAAARRAEAIAFTSSSTVDRSVHLLGPGGMPSVVVTIGPVTSASARARGLAVAAEASPHTIDGLVDAVVEAPGGPPPAGG